MTPDSAPMRARCLTSACVKTTAAVLAAAAAATLLDAHVVLPPTRQPAGQARERHRGHVPAPTPTETPFGSHHVVKSWDCVGQQTAPLHYHIFSP